MDDPHWEHGFRCHGYWIGVVRWGFVGLPPRVFGERVTSYGWEFTPRGIIGHPEPKPGHGGREPTLKRAKARVERAYKEWRANHGQAAQSPLLSELPPAVPGQ